MVDENTNIPKSKSKVVLDSDCLVNNIKQRRKSNELYDDCAQEVRNEDIKPYNMISEKTKNEVLSKMKNKEKKIPNWVTESQSSNTLSYSKVFNASSRDYVKIGDPAKNKSRIKATDLHQENLGSRKYQLSKTIYSSN